MVDTIHVRGEGGTIFEMGLPLPTGVQERLDAGAIVRVNADGTPHAQAVQVPDPDPFELKRPAPTANKPDWVTYAVSQGMSVTEANGHTKGELIELFGMD